MMANESWTEARRALERAGQDEAGLRVAFEERLRGALEAASAPPADVKVLMGLLDVVLNVPEVESFDALRLDLLDLGWELRGMGAEEVHYRTAARALLETLRERLGEATAPIAALLDAAEEVLRDTHPALLAA